jgi:hypothetical protein
MFSFVPFLPDDGSVHELKRVVHNKISIWRELQLTVIFPVRMCRDYNRMSHLKKLFLYALDACEVNI